MAKQSSLDSETYQNYLQCKNLKIIPCSSTMPAVNLSAITWKVNYLVSNLNTEASHVDNDLIAPRGIVVDNNQLWVTNTASDKITNYDLFGNKLLTAAKIRWNRNVTSFPSGIAVNHNGSFPFVTQSVTTVNPSITQGSVSSNARLVVPTKTGDVVAYNPAVDPTRGYVVLSNKLSGEMAEYTGLTIVNNVMYLADFLNGHIDVFDDTYRRIGAPGKIFVDNFSADPIPMDYGPINIVYLDPYLYVVYCKRELRNVVFSESGNGKGYISVFTTNGAFVKRFHSRGTLDAPYSIIRAPPIRGLHQPAFLVNNMGNGRIQMFGTDGNCYGSLLAPSGLPIYIEGCQSLVAHYTSAYQIYFTASNDIESKGSVGCLTMQQI